MLTVELTLLLHTSRLCHVSALSAAILAPSEVLLLWDRIVAFDRLDIRK